MLPIRTLGLRCGETSYAVTNSELEASPDASHEQAIEHHTSAHTFSEWWRNGPLGLEHGFTLAENPCTDTQALSVEVELVGARLANSERGVEVHGVGPVALEYKDLFARDAQGNLLAAWMEPEGATVRLHVDTTNASWPVVIDPLVTTLSGLVSRGAGGPLQGQQGERLGGVIDLIDIYAVAGARLADVGTKIDQGAVYMMTKATNHGQPPEWKVIAKVTAPDGAAGDQFGRAVSISQGNGGTWFIVGAPNAVVNGVKCGAAYVYKFDSLNNVGVLHSKLVPSNPAASDGFGSSVSISVGGVAGALDVIAVGAPLRDGPSMVDRGSVFMFENPGGTWVQQAELVASNAAASDNFGFSVSQRNGSIVAGAPYQDLGALVDVGSVITFTRQSAGIYHQVAITNASDMAASDYFGGTLDLTDGYLAVTASGNGGYRGAVYVFSGGGGNWIQQQKLVLADGAAGYYFGNSVAFAHAPTVTKLVIGEPMRPVVQGGISFSGQGTGHIFTRSGETWTRTNVLTEPITAPMQTTNQLGIGVAADANSVLLGAAGYGFPLSSQGAVLAYDFGNGFTTGAWQMASAASKGDALGTKIAVSGSTVLAQLSKGVVAFVRSGANWVQQQELTYTINTSGLALSGDTALIGPTAYLRTGSTWAQQGTLSVNGFGVPSNVSCTAVSLDTAALGPVSIGGVNYVVVFKRTNGVWAEQQRLANPSPETNDGFGYTCALDVDSLLVSAPSHSANSKPTQGVVYPYQRSGTTWTRLTTLVGGTTTVSKPRFGESVAVRGTTAIVGMPAEVTGGETADTGRVHVFVRNASTWMQQTVITDSAFKGNAAGRGVALGSEVLAFSEKWGPTPDSRVKVWERVNGAWVERSTFNTASLQSVGLNSPSNGASLAAPMGIDGNMLVVGVTGDTPKIGQGVLAYFDFSQSP
ncbi:MAG: hypothetical protein QM778_03360 [Myxococcales bacterium]